MAPRPSGQFHFHVAAVLFRNFEQIAALDRQVKLAEEDLTLSRVRYEGGEGSALDVVTVQNQLAQARAGYYTNLANYLIAKADLEVADGR